MLSIRIERNGGPEVLTSTDMPTPEPGEGEVRVRHTAIGVNFIDTYIRGGLYPVPLPSGLGLEAAGTVEAVGPNTHGLSVGDRVAYGIGPLGAYAEAAVVPVANLVSLPHGIDDQTAAASLLKGMTAYFLLRRIFPVQPDDWILVHAAAGGVGQILCQWGKCLGAKVIGTVGSPDKAVLARSKGCDHPILYREQSVVDVVKDLTDGSGVPVVYDSVGRDTMASSLECLSPRGLLVSYGNASGPPDPVDVLTLAEKGSLFLTRPRLFDYTTDKADMLAAATEVFDLITAGKLDIHLGQTFGLRDAAE
ncbi:MAG: quinone oxidoreductase, partial [Pseudomonadota bacterium]